MDTNAPTPAPEPVVYTNKARCRDCYRCLRACPVKAIRVLDGQASVIEEQCLACGTCVRECPQHAKTFRKDTARAAALLRGDVPVAASIAPSFAAIYGEERRRRLPDALRRLGFAYVGETALGAAQVAQATAQLVRRAPDRPHITTACPAAVRYAEQYAPDLVGHLTPLVSPMVAHALHVRRTRGAAMKVVFIGPCVAKKAEAEQEEARGAVDVVLTFDELDGWLEHEGIALDACQEAGFDELPEENARFFPLPGGLARTAGLATDMLARTSVAASGPEEMRQVLDSLRAKPQAVLVEALFCEQGCVNGAGACGACNLYDRRAALLDYAGSEPAAAAASNVPDDLNATYAAVKPGRDVPDELVEEVLARTGKSDPKDQLNCAACGYPTCRQQAAAVAAGTAEIEMCIPYMRRLAEQRSDRIIETTPNGIVVLDEQLRILHMNPSFRAMFQGTDALLGKTVSCLMDPEPFERLMSGDAPKLELTVDHSQYGRVCRHILYRLPEDRQIVGILVDITKLRSSEEELGRLRGETLEAAQELMEQQFEAAREIAVFLGKSTARSEEVVRNLKALTAGEQPTSLNRWLWDTSTSTSP